MDNMPLRVLSTFLPQQKGTSVDLQEEGCELGMNGKAAASRASRWSAPNWVWTVFLTPVTSSTYILLLTLHQTLGRWVLFYSYR